MAHRMCYLYDGGFFLCLNPPPPPPFLGVSSLVSKVKYVYGWERFGCHGWLRSVPG